MCVPVQKRGLRPDTMGPKRGHVGKSAGTPMANQLLAALPRAAYRRLLPRLEPTTLKAGQRLFPPTGALQFAYFPTDSIVTLLYALEEGAMAKAWPVGREGMVGISMILGNPHRDNRADVQVGGLAFRMSASVLLVEFRRGGALQRLLLRYVFALITQASQLCVCSQHHLIEQRLCRFLSRAFDRIDGDELLITQERMSQCLGVRRESITEAAPRLQQAGIIQYYRGHMALLNQKKLEERACACAGIIRRAFAAVSEQDVAKHR